MIASDSSESRLQGRNFLTVTDLAPDEIGRVLRLATHLRDARTADQLPLLRGKTLGMLFEKPSLRTRVSFEVGMTQLGGHAMIAHGSDFMVGSRESPEDAARVLSRYVDAIVVRTHAHEPLQRFAAAATVPVINGLSAAAHPCQALADLLTIKERFDALQG
jgi:ornithine carbamoyltransferase